MKTFSLRWEIHLQSLGQNYARVEALREMLRILQESEANHWDGIATGDESRSPYFYLYSKMFA
jgi:hypothetical protein